MRLAHRLTAKHQHQHRLATTRHSAHLHLLPSARSRHPQHSQQQLLHSHSHRNQMAAQPQHKHVQPEWQVPAPVAPTPVLKVNNSMTHSKTDFIPANGKQVNWYTCGPTVYDFSHLGHARTYISFDVIRRIMEDYFNYDVTLVMNITDIDDKIIIAARKKYLFAKKKESITSLSQNLIDELEEAWKTYINSHLGKYLGEEKEAGWNDLVERAEKGQGPSLADEPKFDMWMKIAKKSRAALDKAVVVLKSGQSDKSVSDILIDESKDTLSEFLDKSLKETVTDHSIFRDFAAHWEKEYFKDMDALNIRRPDVLTRVSEYVPEIVTFVEQIIKNGFAYESNGSVYFDTVKFDKHPSHSYAKLEPWSASNIKLLQEGEGDLSAPTADGKRNKADFALWKSSKPGEPAWPSPWGEGRPGWHIECSAMAGDVLGEKLDIHAGGIDLAFPHHDNEIAQSEGHYNCRQWVNYFLHTGHLHIEGQKMSKSLKNFLTISETLEKYTATQIRIMMLLHSWDSVLDFKESSLQEARVFELAINNFLVNVKALVQEHRAAPEVFTGNHNFHSAEKDLLKYFQDRQSLIHTALCDNFDTATVMNLLRDIITSANTYQSKMMASKTSPSSDLLLKIAKYVTKMMRIFGVFREGNPEVGEVAGGSTSVGGGGVEEVAGPYVRLLAAFRDKVRELARAKADPSAFLQSCDKLRDEDLVDLNIALDDRDDGRALVKFVDRATILKQREEKKEAALAAAQEKEKKRQELLALEAERLAKGAIRPQDMFKDEEGLKLYSRWDEQGLPTHTITGEEVSKKGTKKMQKAMEAQAKLHERYLASLAKGEN